MIAILIAGIFSISGQLASAQELKDYGVNGSPGCSGMPFDLQLEKERLALTGFSPHQDDIRGGCNPGGIEAERNDSSILIAAANGTVINFTYSGYK